MHVDDTILYAPGVISNTSIGSSRVEMLETQFRYANIACNVSNWSPISRGSGRIHSNVLDTTNPRPHERETHFLVVLPM